VSGCNLKTELGKMQGYYNMENVENREAIQVKIPAFKMIAPVKLN
jgi:ApaG protein